MSGTVSNFQFLTVNNRCIQSVCLTDGTKETTLDLTNIPPKERGSLVETFFLEAQKQFAKDSEESNHRLPEGVSMFGLQATAEGTDIRIQQAWTIVAQSGRFTEHRTL